LHSTTFIVFYKNSILHLWNAVLLFISNAISEEEIVITSCGKHFCNQLLFAKYRIYMIS